MSIRIAMYAGNGANPPRLIQSLRRFGFSVWKIQKERLADLAGDGFDGLYLPGGWYQFDQPGKQAIKRFVRNGGACVGTCAGAYNVCGSIPVIPGKVLNCDMRGRLYLEPQQGNHPILRGVVRRCTRHNERDWEPIAVAHMGGPIILPRDKTSIVASYDTQGSLGAIVAADVGKGRAVALASHPEHPLRNLPPNDARSLKKGPLLQGDARLLIRNAVLWAVRQLS